MPSYTLPHLYVVKTKQGDIAFPNKIPAEAFRAFVVGNGHKAEIDTISLCTESTLSMYKDCFKPID